VKATSVPSVAVTKIMARAAGVSEKEAFDAVAKKEAELHPKKQYLKPALASLAVTLFLTATPEPAQANGSQPTFYNNTNYACFWCDPDS
jgi:hypothetical protein